MRDLSGLEKTYQRQQMIKDPKTIELLLSFIGLVKATCYRRWKSSNWRISA
ncbi:hypothetical protein JCM19237_2797 [Photobacterium aphoticum]|uniref:Uncharacterized protein n=1 Tax=Photobacterium aphoticum TaxID=754436 RepID=A0A090QU36_9GAMM|nr:hypothetical protein JCM19237_2797 [Photobacterium aphoticum]